MKHARDWKARRRGSIYCAPACGLGCTWGEYQAAKKQAAALVETLADTDSDIKGGKWRAYIWENLGWFCSVTKGLVTVYGLSHGSDTYMAFLNISGPWGGSMVVKGKSPKLAVRKLLGEARRQLRGMVELVERLGVK